MPTARRFVSARRIFSPSSRFIMSLRVSSDSDLDAQREHPAAGLPQPLRRTPDRSGCRRARCRTTGSASFRAISSSQNRAERLDVERDGVAPEVEERQAVGPDRVLDLIDERLAICSRNLWPWWIGATQKSHEYGQPRSSRPAHTACRRAARDTDRDRSRSQAGWGASGTR